MSPRPQTYWKDRRRLLARTQRCILNPQHGPARPMRTTCAACGEKIRQRNAVNNPKRKKES